MQDLSKEKDSGIVISMFDQKKVEAQKAASSAEGLESEPKKPESFLDVMRKNAENSERIRKERLKANKGVLRSYRIKN